MDKKYRDEHGIFQVELLPDHEGEKVDEGDYSPIIYIASYSVSTSDEVTETIIGAFDTSEKAKAACEKHYQFRIHAALEWDELSEAKVHGINVQRYRLQALPLNRELIRR